ncbi:hypothetical protein IID24_03035 [Patescibacteria group bacterium]|nr:hypothetical protein [Patescibacteria group bacterium]
MEESLFDKLKSFEALKDGWDSYQGKPITESALSTARELIPHLLRFSNAKDIFVCPLGDGGVEFEYETGCLDIMITVKP